MTSPRQQFGEALRDARELRPAGRWTQKQLAREVRTSASTISRLERGEGPIPSNLPPLFDQVFDTDGLFKSLYEKSRADDFPAHSRRRMEVELRAVKIIEWSPTVVPGLLQTPAYARELLRNGDLRASEREIATMVGARMSRQDVLKGSSPPYLSVVVCESVLQRNVGGREVMREQLGVLLARGALHTNVLQVLPLHAATHGLMDGAMSVLTSPDGTSIVYAEGVRSATITDELAVVRDLERAYDVLTASALSPAASADLIRELMEAS
ncbi:helix-turn-helix transcriptional regulator [Streptomyces sp. PSRA5]|uniref:helix-turn-helix domain-containing protein n=1 Tax=Streptomyces panacea TaxID=3035064 RepID=UPI00339C778D